MNDAERVKILREALEKASTLDVLYSAFLVAPRTITPAMRQHHSEACEINAAISDALAATEATPPMPEEPNPIHMEPCEVCGIALIHHTEEDWGHLYKPGARPKPTEGPKRCNSCNQLLSAGHNCPWPTGET